MPRYSLCVHFRYVVIVVVVIFCAQGLRAESFSPEHLDAWTDAGPCADTPDGYDTHACVMIVDELAMDDSWAVHISIDTRTDSDVVLDWRDPAAATLEDITVGDVTTIDMNSQTWATFFVTPEITRSFIITPDEDRKEGEHTGSEDVGADIAGELVAHGLGGCAQSSSSDSSDGDGGCTTAAARFSSGALMLLLPLAACFLNRWRRTRRALR